MIEMNSTISAKKTIFVQLTQFVLVGGINTVVDFGILNILISLFGTNPAIYPYLKAISFIVAVINSYILNKYWVFNNAERSSIKKEGVLFFTISIVGFLLNVTIASLIFNQLSKFYDYPRLIANIGSLVATIVVLTWNFVGYKLIVFKT